MQRKRLIKQSYLKLTLAIIALLCFGAGIPIICIYAKYSTFLLTLGILMVVFGFYGSPMLFISYGSNKVSLRVYDAIVSEGLYSNIEISKQLSMSEADVKSNIQSLINKQYLIGYLYDGVSLKSNTNVPKNNVKQHKCSSCGGTLTKVSDGYICKYCGSKFDKDEK